MSTKIIIQPYSSRFETPRVRFSNEAYEAFGTKTFFQEKVPFAERTGPTFAKHLVKLLVLKFSDRKIYLQYRKTKIHIYEFGAGTGILAKRILNLLEKNHPELYAKTVLHISDISQKAIAELKNSGVFARHKNHILFEVMDAVNPIFAQKPFLVYFTDLLTSLSCRHIQTIDGQIFEIQIQTFIEDDAQTIDVRQYPPKLIDSKDIISPVNSANTQKKLILAPQLIKIFKEEYRRVPVGGLQNMSEEEKSDLKNLCSVVANERIFNYCFAAKQCLQRCLSSLEPGGFLLFSDFGTTSKETSEFSLWTEYGIIICFALDFYGLLKDSEGLGATVTLASNVPGGPQELLIDAMNDKKFTAAFKKLFGWNYQSQVESFLSTAQTVLFENLSEKQKVRRLTKLLNALPKPARKDYLLLNDLALFFQMSGLHRLALKYCRMLEKEYQHTAGAYCFMIRGQAYQSLGNLKLAEKNYKKAIFFNNPTAIAHLGNLYLLQRRYPDHIKTVKNYITYSRKGDYLKSMLFIGLAYEKMIQIKRAIETLNEAVAFAKNIHSLSDEEHKILEQIRTKLSLFNTKSSVDLRRKSRTKTWDKNSIVILLGSQPTPWAPDGLIKPKETFLGGSEEAAVYLSQELHNLDWKVTVYAEPREKEEIKAGVTWLNYYHFNPKDKFNILIYWRHAHMIDLNCQAKQVYFWTHDIQNDINFPKKRLKKINKIIVLSKAHRTNLPKTPSDKIMISSNAYYEHSPQIKSDNNPHTCIYTSSYDRGLEHLLTIWPDVKRSVPDAQLHIFYGWQMFERVYQFDQNAPGWKDQIIALMEQPGVTHHGRVPQTEVENWYKKCGIFAYPSHFFEISCISAMKAQAYGAVPVTTTIGALDETVQFGIKIKGDINKPKVLEEYKKALIKVLKDQKWQEKQRQQMVPWAKRKFSWTQVAKQWSDEFKLFKNKKN